MAITQNPLIGQASGSAGGLTFQYYQRKNVLRRKPFAPRNPSTPAQVAVRAIFASQQINIIGQSDRFLQFIYPAKPHKISRLEAFKQFLLQQIKLKPSYPADFTPLTKYFGGSGYTAPSDSTTHWRGFPAYNRINVQPFGQGGDFPDCIFYEVYFALYTSIDNTLRLFKLELTDEQQTFTFTPDDPSVLYGVSLSFVIYLDLRHSNILLSSKLLVS